LLITFFITINVIMENVLCIYCLLLLLLETTKHFPKHRCNTDFSVCCKAVTSFQFFLFFVFFTPNCLYITCVWRGRRCRPSASLPACPEGGSRPRPRPSPTGRKKSNFPGRRGKRKKIVKKSMPLLRAGIEPAT